VKIVENRWKLPDLGLGVGLRTKHFAHILGQKPQMGFFEALTENFLDTGGRPAYVLDQVAESYPIVLHGVSLSIGSTDPLNFEYLAKVRDLARRTKARLVSDHFCWTGVAGRNTHDLLPLPYTEQALRHTVERIRTVQDFLERPLVLENPSTYIEFVPSSMPEWEFIARALDEADCGLLLDVNNVFVSAFNHGFDPKTWIDAMPPERVCQFHLAGHTNKGTHILDTHSDHVIEPVWDLFGHTLRRTSLRSTLLEWDADIPEFETLQEEVEKARPWREEEGSHAAA
jgi:uncharacterized protein (UPF0276 family)